MCSVGRAACAALRLPAALAAYAFAPPTHLTYVPHPADGPCCDPCCACPALHPCRPPARPPACACLPATPPHSTTRATQAACTAGTTWTWRTTGWRVCQRRRRAARRGSDGQRRRALSAAVCAACFVPARPPAHFSPSKTSILSFLHRRCLISGAPASSFTCFDPRPELHPELVPPTSAALRACRRPVCSVPSPASTAGSTSTASLRPWCVPRRSVVVHPASGAAGGNAAQRTAAVPQGLPGPLRAAPQQCSASTCITGTRHPCLQVPRCSPPASPALA